MSSALDSFEAVEAYAAEHGGVDGLRVMHAMKTITGARRDMVGAYLEQHDAMERLAEDRDRAQQREAEAIRGIDAAERSANAAERSASAAERSATATERAARWALTAAVVSLFGIIVNAALVFFRHS